jgi:broad specificity phosphatase PhoE
LTADLREQQQNSLNGRKVDEVDWDNLPPDVENEFQMSQRAKKILSQTYQQYSDKTVLFVTHKRFENILINLLLNKDHSDKSDLEKIKNSSVSVFEVNENLEGVPVVLHTISHI